MRIFTLVVLLGASVAIANANANANANEGAASIPQLETTLVLTGHEGWVRTLAFHPQGALLASGGPDRTLRVWNLAQEEQVAIHTLPRGG